MTVAPSFEPLDRRTLAHEVRERVASAIASGVFAPGAQLPSERVLCVQFGVARTSVREAIQGLVTLGLVSRRGNRTYVAEHLPEIPLDAGADRRKIEVRELFEVRRAIEVPMVRLAACRATQEQREEIAQLAAQFEGDLTIVEFRNLDRAFHWALARASGNSMLAELYGKVLDRLFRSEDFESLLTSKVNRKAVKQIISGSSHAHRVIAEAMLRHDPDAVMKEIEGHLDQVEDSLISQLL